MKQDRHQTQVIYGSNVILKKLNNKRLKEDKRQLLPIWRSCAAAWRCWSWESSCWSHWQWRTWSPWSHSCWGREMWDNRFVLVSILHIFLQQDVQTTWLSYYRIGIAGFFVPNFVSKMKPSNAMKRNWAKVTMFPHPGNCLQDTTTENIQVLYPRC